MLLGFLRLLQGSHFFLHGGLASVSVFKGFWQGFLVRGIRNLFAGFPSLASNFLGIREFP